MHSSSFDSCEEDDDHDPDQIEKINFIFLKLELVKNGSGGEKRIR